MGCWWSWRLERSRKKDLSKDIMGDHAFQNQANNIRPYDLFKYEGQLVPTSLSCSEGGNVVAVAFTDETIKIVDFRIKNSGEKSSPVMVLEGEHSEFIKNIQLSSDGTVLFSSGADCVVKVWDLGTRRCVQTIGPELNAIQRKQSIFHKDSITSMEVNFEQDFMFTGGRDGSIFRTDLSSDVQADDESQQQIFSKVHQGDSKFMITCMQYDAVNGKLWYGTPSSAI